MSPALWRALEEAQRIGAIGPGSLHDHVRHAAAFGELLATVLREGARVLDLGSGGGLPGLVLAELWPQCIVVLLDGRSERGRQLEASTATAGLADRTRVVAQRAEVAAHDPLLRGAFDVVVARGFGPPSVTAECGAPFLVTGGQLCVSEPPAARPFGRWPEEAIGHLGLRHERAEIEPYAFVLLRSVEPCPARYPRRVGVPTKRPLF